MIWTGAGGYIADVSGLFHDRISRDFRLFFFYFFFTKIGKSNSYHFGWSAVKQHPLAALINELCGPWNFKCKNI